MSSSKKFTILIIEDDHGLAELIKDRVEECGYETACAYSALEAIEWLSGYEPFIMLLDYTLPDMNAKEFISALQGKEQPLPAFIISTGQGDERIAVEMMKLGARDYIIKDSQYLEMLPEIIIRVAREIENEGKRRQAEFLLEQTRRNYETFFNTIDDFLFVLSEAGDIIYTNNTVTDRLGYTTEELSGKSILMVHPPERRDEAGIIVGEMLRGETEFCPVPIITKSGIQIPVETRVSSGFWDGKPVLFGVTKDISKVKLSEEKFSKLFYINPSACGLSDLDNHIYIDVNEAFYTLFGFNKNEVVGKSPMELGILSDEIINAVLLKADSNGNVSNVETVLKAKNGDLKRVLMSSENIYVQDKKYRFTIVNDITERKHAEEALRESEYRLKFSIEGFGGGAWEWKVQTGETILNERSASIIGYTLDELEPVSSATWIKYHHPDDLKKSIELLAKHFSGESEYYEFESRMKHKNGNWVWVLNKGKVIEWSKEFKPLRMFGIHMDVTEKREMYQKIEELSIRDPLTNLFNRRYIFERLEVIVSEFLREKKNFTISIIDLDYFKDVNDKYGHQAGDLILSEFAEIISSNLRPYDLAGRYGGEEFILISMNVSRNQTESRIERILDIMREKKFIYNENEIKITFSCGIAESLELETVSVGVLIETADKRLYHAKNTGRNKVVISC